MRRILHDYECEARIENTALGYYVARGFEPEHAEYLHADLIWRNETHYKGIYSGYFKTYEEACEAVEAYNAF